MRKIAFLLALLLLLSIPLTAQAATRNLAVYSNLTYSGTTATCTVRISGGSATNCLEATIKLWNGNTCIKTWTATGDGYIIFSKTATVTTGNTYTLTVDWSIDGVAQATSSVSKKCE